MPDHPVLFHAGPAGTVNSKALEVSKITRDTPSPRNGMLVKGPKTGEPTGMVRSAYQLLKGVPSKGSRVSAEKLRAGLIKQFALYNAEGITSVSDRNGSRSGLMLYRDLAKKGITPDGYSHEATMIDEAALFDKLDRIEALVRTLVERQTMKDWYTTEEAARVLGKSGYTIRELCRLGRIRAEKKGSGRGRYQAWVISHEELLRVQKEGLLPLQRPA